MITIKGEIYSSKNSRIPMRNGKGVKSAQAKKNEGDMILQLNTQREKWVEMTSGIRYPLQVVFYFRRRTLGRWDFLNICQGVADAMVKAEYIPDDDVTHFMPVLFGWEKNKENPGVDFWIGDLWIGEQ